MKARRPTAEDDGFDRRWWHENVAPHPVTLCLAIQLVCFAGCMLLLLLGAVCGRRGEGLLRPTSWRGVRFGYDDEEAGS